MFLSETGDLEEKRGRENIKTANTKTSSERKRKKNEWWPNNAVLLYVMFSSLTQIIQDAAQSENCSPMSSAFCIIAQFML